MNDFPDFEFEGLGGGKSFNFLPFHDLNEIPHTIYDTLSEAVTLISGKSWYTGNSLPRTLRYNQVHNPEDNTWTITVSGKLKANDSDVLPLFKAMCTREHIVDITDHNGNRRLIGTNEYGMSFTFTQDTSETQSGRNEYTFTFSIIQDHPPYIYSPA